MIGSTGEITENDECDCRNSADKLDIAPLVGLVKQERQALSCDHAETDRYLMQSTEYSAETLWRNFRQVQRDCHKDQTRRDTDQESYVRSNRMR